MVRSDAIHPVAPASRPTPETTATEADVWTAVASLTSQWSDRKRVEIKHTMVRAAIKRGVAPAEILAAIRNPSLCMFSMSCLDRQRSGKEACRFRHIPPAIGQPSRPAQPPASVLNTGGTRAAATAGPSSRTTDTVSTGAGDRAPINPTVVVANPAAGADVSTTFDAKLQRMSDAFTQQIESIAKIVTAWQESREQRLREPEGPGQQQQPKTDKAKVNEFIDLTGDKLPAGVTSRHGQAHSIEHLPTTSSTVSVAPPQTSGTDLESQFRQSRLAAGMDTVTGVTREKVLEMWGRIGDDRMDLVDGLVKHGETDLVAFQTARELLLCTREVVLDHLHTKQTAVLSALNRPNVEKYNMLWQSPDPTVNVIFNLTRPQLRKLFVNPDQLDGDFRMLLDKVLQGLREIKPTGRNTVGHHLNTLGHLPEASEVVGLTKSFIKHCVWFFYHAFLGTPIFDLSYPSDWPQFDPKFVRVNVGEPDGRKEWSDGECTASMTAAMSTTVLWPGIAQIDDQGVEKPIFKVKGIDFRVQVYLPSAHVRHSKESGTTGGPDPSKQQQQQQQKPPVVTQDLPRVSGNPDGGGDGGQRDAGANETEDGCTERVISYALDVISLIVLILGAGLLYAAAPRLWTWVTTEDGTQADTGLRLVLLALTALFAGGTLLLPLSRLSNSVVHGKVCTPQRRRWARNRLKDHVIFSVIVGFALCGLAAFLPPVAGSTQTMGLHMELACCATVHVASELALDRSC